jgi:hypothetical protein
MKPILLTGSAPNSLSDVIRFMVSFPEIEPDFMAIGLDAIDKHLHGLKYFATYHVEDIALAKDRRCKINGNLDYKTIAHTQWTAKRKGAGKKKVSGVDILINDVKPSGSSALFGTRAAIHLGYDKIILCGCPLRDEYVQYQEGWVEYGKHSSLDKVRSMSGWTADFLGMPTREWLN